MGLAALRFPIANALQRPLPVGDATIANPSSTESIPSTISDHVSPTPRRGISAVAVRSTPRNLSEKRIALEIVDLIRRVY
jgi:hypothetical protein